MTRLLRNVLMTAAAVCAFIGVSTANAAPDVGDVSIFLWNPEQVTGDVSQVRIEQRVTIRIPGIRSPAAQPLADLRNREPLARRMTEKKAGSCIKTNDIAGVQISSASDSLLVHMDDSQMLRVYLDPTCHARHFYSGFYVERDKDGKICAGRDELLSRSGARCQISKFRELVPDKD